MAGLRLGETLAMSREGFDRYPAGARPARGRP